MQVFALQIRTPEWNSCRAEVDSRVAVLKGEAEGACFMKLFEQLPAATAVKELNEKILDRRIALTGSVLDAAEEAIKEIVNTILTQDSDTWRGNHQNGLFVQCASRLHDALDDRGRPSNSMLLKFLAALCDVEKSWSDVRRLACAKTYL